MNRDLENNISETWTRHVRRGEFEAAWRVGDAVLKSRDPASTQHLPRHLQNVTAANAEG